MSKFNLYPKLAAKTFGGFVLFDILCLVLFGFPGICGTVGGLVPTYLPSLAQTDFAGYAGVALYALGFFGTPLSLLWLALAGLLRLAPPPRPTRS